jgi:hypothetical protein
MKHEIKTMKLKDLVPADYNPRTISSDALNGLSASLKKFGLVQPIVYNKRTKRIVGGHQRVNALKLNGETDATVVVVDLKESDEKALNITLNNPNIQGEFTDALNDLLAELVAADPIIVEDLNLADLMLPIDPYGSAENVISFVQRFIVPPFSVFDARQGYWQERKRQWLNLGIRSDLGRGENLFGHSDLINNKMKKRDQR